MLDLDSVFSKASATKIAVLGDLMLDEWIIGSADRISPEAPVPVVRFERRVTAPGGAANVVMNLLSLGGAATMGGVVGHDEAGRDLAQEIQDAGAEVGALVYDPSRPTTLKTRIVAQRQQMVRVDRESLTPLSEDVHRAALDALPTLIAGCQVLCISDYNKSLASAGMFESAVSTALSAGLLVTGGPKPQNLERFAGAHFLSFNQKEATDASGLNLSSIEAVEEAGLSLRERANVQALAITRGSNGVSLFQRDQAPVHIPAHRVEVFDVAGAGDTFLAGATLALACGSDAVSATEFGNLAAAASVRRVGVVAVTPDEVTKMLGNAA